MCKPAGTRWQARGDMDDAKLRLCNWPWEASGSVVVVVVVASGQDGMKIGVGLLPSVKSE